MIKDNGYSKKITVSEKDYWYISTDDIEGYTKAFDKLFSKGPIYGVSHKKVAKRFIKCLLKVKKEKLK